MLYCSGVIYRNDPLLHDSFFYFCHSILQYLQFEKNMRVYEMCPLLCSPVLVIRFSDQVLLFCVPRGFRKVVLSAWVEGVLQVGCVLCEQMRFY